MLMDLLTLREPIVQAPLSGGVSTPALGAAVSEAGGLGFLASGYKTPAGVRDDLRLLRSLTAEPYGLNIFVPQSVAAPAAALSAYASGLRPEAQRYQVDLGEPRFDDDSFAEKVELAVG